MNLRLFATVAALSCACVARGAQSGPSYAVLSLVGDKFDVVTYQMQTGSRVDNNSHAPIVMGNDEIDTVALRTVGQVLRDNVPGAQVTLLAASTHDSFENQERMFDGDRVKLPPEIDAAVRREGATMLILVTKHHGDARLQARSGAIGSGRLEGLGFYLDQVQRMKRIDPSSSAIGYIAPFVYVDVALVDVASGTVTRRTSIATGRVIPVPNDAKDPDPWDVLTGAEKLKTLEALLATELGAAIAPLVAASPARSTPAPAAAASQ